MKDSAIENDDAKGINLRFSVFRLTRWEILIAVVVGIAVLIGFRAILLRTLPFPCGIGSNGEIVGCDDWTFDQSWKHLGSSLFFTFSIPIAIILALSAVFLWRAICKDASYFSTLGNVALALPLISFPISNYMFQGLYLQVLGMVIGFIAAVKSINSKRHSVDWLAFALSVVYFVFFLVYYAQWWNSYGD